MTFAEVIPSMSEIQKKYRDAICETGTEQKDGSYLVRYEEIGDHLDRKVPTVMSNLRLMANAGLIKYEMSGSAKPFRIKGGIEDIPTASLDRLQVRADEASEKLAQVIELHNLSSSEDKHAYMEQFLAK